MPNDLWIAMSQTPWFSLDPKERDKCEHCGRDITARFALRGTRKYCSQACARAATGQEFDPAEMDCLGVL